MFTSPLKRLVYSGFMGNCQNFGDEIAEPSMPVRPPSCWRSRYAVSD